MKPPKESKIADTSRNGFLGVERKVPVENKLSSRKEYAHMAISLWLNAVASDSSEKILERKKVLSFIKLLFEEGSIFPDSQFTDEEQKKILLELVSEKVELLSIETIANYLKDKKDISLAFFYDACLIVFLDGRVVSSENDFLEKFSGLINLSKIEKDKIMDEFRKEL